MALRVGRLKAYAPDNNHKFFGTIASHFSKPYDADGGTRGNGLVAGAFLAHTVATLAR